MPRELKLVLRNLFFTAAFLFTLRLWLIKYQLHIKFICMPETFQQDIYNSNYKLGSCIFIQRKQSRLLSIVSDFLRSPQSIGACLLQFSQHLPLVFSAFSLHTTRLYLNMPCQQSPKLCTEVCQTDIFMTGRQKRTPVSTQCYSGFVYTASRTKLTLGPKNFAIPWVKLRRIKYNFTEAKDLEIQSLFF